MVTSAFAIKENFTIKNQNKVAMVQTSKEITRWFYECNFRLDLVLLNTWVFWVRLGCHHSQNNVCWQLINATLLFYKTRQLATWLQVSPKCQDQTGFWAYSSKKTWDLFCLLKFQLSLLQLLLIGSVIPKWQTKGLRFCNHTSLIIIQDSDLELGTQKYFQFSVSSPSWGSPVLHFDKKLSQS